MKYQAPSGLIIRQSEVKHRHHDSLIHEIERLVISAEKHVEHDIRMLAFKLRHVLMNH